MYVGGASGGLDEPTCTPSSTGSAQVRVRGVVVPMLQFIPERVSLPVREGRRDEEVSEDWAGEQVDGLERVDGEALVAADVRLQHLHDGREHLRGLHVRIGLLIGIRVA